MWLWRVAEGNSCPEVDEGAPPRDPHIPMHIRRSCSNPTQSACLAGTGIEQATFPSPSCG